MEKYGIDISEFQGKIDWGKVSKAVSFAILRAGYGKVVSQKDRCFEANYTACKANNVPVGAYWYSYAMNPAEAVQEAETCLKAIQGKQFEYPIYYDIEESRQLALGKDACTAIAKAFFDKLEAAGYWVGLYSSKSHLETAFTKEIRQRYAVWVAHYGVEKTDYSGQFGLWQRQDTGYVSGIKGNVDIDVSYIDYPALIKSAGKNGFKKTVAETATTTAKPDNAPVKLVKGAKVDLKQVSLYPNAYSKSAVRKLTGAFYVYDGQEVNGRIRITTTAQNCGKLPVGLYVTGFVDKSDIK